MTVRHVSVPVGQPARHAGVALLAVLWVVAIMTVVATALVSTVRTERRTTQGERASVQALALGQAAIALVVQQHRVQRQENPLDEANAYEMQFDGVTMPVRLEPVGGFLDVNHTPADTLAQVIAAVAPEADAPALAQNWVQWRDEVQPGGQKRTIEVLEDLLQIPGFGYDLFVRLAPVLTTMNGAATQLDANLLNPELLTLLGLAAQNTGTELPSARRNSYFYRITASVPLEGQVYRVTQDVMLDASMSGDGAPWQIVAASPAYAVP